MNEQREAPVTCQVCGKEVPRSAALSAEGRDYTYFFCSEGCRQRWNADLRFERERGDRR